MPEEITDLVVIMATGRGDYQNRINNVLAIPGIFRGALGAPDARVASGAERHEPLSHVIADQGFCERNAQPTSL